MADGKLGTVQTTDATQTTLLALSLEDTSIYWVRAKIVGRDGGGTKRAVYVRTVMAYREGGSATLGAGGVQDDFTDETTAGWDGTFTVSSNDLRVSVTGEAATTINWACVLEFQKVS
jgi:hypothetical protein